MPSLGDNSASADRGRWRIRYPDLQSLSESGHLIQRPETISHSNAVMALAYSRDSRLLVTGAKPTPDGKGNNAGIFIWNTSSKTIERTLEKDASKDYPTVFALAFSPDGKRIASGDSSGQLEVWDVESGECIEAIPGRIPEHAIHALAWSPDGKWIVSGSDDANIYLWDAETYVDWKLKIPGGEGKVASMCFSRNSRWLASEMENRRWHIWSVVGEDKSHWHIELSLCRGLMWLGGSDADGRQLVACLKDGSVYASSGRVDKDGTLEAPECVEDSSGYSARNAVFSEDGSYVLTRSKSSPSAIRLRDLSEHRLVFEGEMGEIKAMCISPDGKYVAFACKSLDFTACVWRVRDCTLIGINQHDAEVEWIMFSPDGATFASGSNDGTVCIRSVEGKDSGGA